jgi:hypothetical protein
MPATVVNPSLKKAVGMAYKLNIRQQKLIACGIEEMLDGLAFDETLRKTAHKLKSIEPYILSKINDGKFKEF